MNIAGRIARGFALAAWMIIGTSQAASGDCFKNHYILSGPCVEEWKPANGGLTDPDVRVVALDPVDEATLYAGGPTGIYKSSDAGATWRLVMTPRTYTWEDYPAWHPYPPPLNFVARSTVTTLAVDPSNPRIVYAGTERTDGCMYTQQRIYKSVDAGGTWSNSLSPMNGCDSINALLVDPVRPSTLYVSSFDHSMGDTPYPLLRTDDGARSWEPLRYQVTNTLAIDPLADTVYAGTFAFEPYYTTLPNGVLKSRDRGTTWAPTALTGIGISALATDPMTRDTVYAATFHTGDWRPPRTFKGLFRSFDGGASWRAAHQGLSHFVDTPTWVTTLIVDPLESRTLYLGTSDAGVWRSVDGGDSWSAFNQGLPTLRIRSLALAPGVPNTLYAGTAAGVFKIDDIRPRLSMRAARGAMAR